MVSDILKCVTQAYTECMFGRCPMQRRTPRSVTSWCLVTTFTSRQSTTPLWRRQRSCCASPPHHTTLLRWCITLLVCPLDIKCVDTHNFVFFYTLTSQMFIDSITTTTVVFSTDQLVKTWKEVGLDLRPHSTVECTFCQQPLHFELMSERERSYFIGLSHMISAVAWH